MLPDLSTIIQSIDDSLLNLKKKTSIHNCVAMYLTSHVGVCMEY